MIKSTKNAKETSVNDSYLCTFTADESNKIFHGHTTVMVSILKQREQSIEIPSQANFWITDYGSIVCELRRWTFYLQLTS